jgi:hypothetical protein
MVSLQQNFKFPDQLEIKEFKKKENSKTKIKRK